MLEPGVNVGVLGHGSSSPYHWRRACEQAKKTARHFRSFPAPRELGLKKKIRSLFFFVFFFWEEGVFSSN